MKNADTNSSPQRQRKKRDIRDTKDARDILFFDLVIWRFRDFQFQKPFLATNYTKKHEKILDFKTFDTLTL